MSKWTKSKKGSTIPEIVSKNMGLPIEDINKNWQTPIQNLQKIADRLKTASEKGETVTVFADYDCDGICSAVIMDLILRTLKIEFKVLFPHRSTGYGIQPHDFDQIASDIVITIDNGIAAFDAVNIAREKGIEIIIIDHHLKPEKGVPEANIIVDPHVFKEEESDFEDWCGAGLGYELSRLICPSIVQKIAVQFAAIATVADVVPLKKDNRRILQEGLPLLRSSSLGSVQMLVRAVSGTIPFVDESTIGFKIGPIINAMGRIEDDAEYVYKYFISGDPSLLQHMLEVNEKRKELVSNAVERAHNIIAEEILFNDVPLVIYDPDTTEGILGIVAGRLAEEKKIPVICLSDASEEGVIKGSARSPADVNIKETLDKVSDYLLGYGGHAGAAGLSLKKGKLEDLRNKFRDLFADYEVKENDEILYDIEISANDIRSSVEALKEFAPFGEGNKAPVFKITNFKLLPKQGNLYQLMGDDNSTIKLFGGEVSAIGFGMVEKYNNTGLCRSLNLIGKLGENHFTTNPEIQVELMDFEKIEEPKRQTKLSAMLADKLGGF